MLSSVTDTAHLTTSRRCKRSSRLLLAPRCEFPRLTVLVTFCFSRGGRETLIQEMRGALSLWLPSHGGAWIGSSWWW